MNSNVKCEWSNTTKLPIFCSVLLKQLTAPLPNTGMDLLQLLFDLVYKFWVIFLPDTQNVRWLKRLKSRSRTAQSATWLLHNLFTPRTVQFKSTSRAIYHEQSHTKQHALQVAWNVNILYIHVHVPNACLVVVFVLCESKKPRVNQYFWKGRKNVIQQPWKENVDNKYCSHPELHPRSVDHRCDFCFLWIKGGEAIMWTEDCDKSCP